MNPMPTQMRDRWANRAEPGVGQGTVYWHVLMRDYPEAIAAAKDAQSIVSAFPGFHLPPREWLHMTTYVAGPTEEIAPDQMEEMLHRARASTSTMPPIAATIGRVLYHPEAIMLGLEPRENLLPILDVARDATASVANVRARGDYAETWTPHVTISYSIADQDASPISDALGRAVNPRRVAINTLSLVVQWGPERAWDWQVLETLNFGER